MNTPERDLVLHRVLTDLDCFGQLVPARRLRGYQLEPANAIFESILHCRGDQFAVVFSRQAGKDEMLAQLLAFLLLRLSRTGGSVVVAAPTLEPQALITRDRLRDYLQSHPITSPRTRSVGATVEVGKARATFVSAASRAGARGQTASHLLVANEAQDIEIDTWDAVFDPMAASTNATTVFMGTVWSAHTLLARQMRHLRTLEASDGRQRVFEVPWQRVAEVIPAYGHRVRARIAQLGATHPFIRTEYGLEELAGDAGLFPAHRRAQMQGSHPRRLRAEPGKRYAMLIDVGGEEEAGSGPNGFLPGARRDSTALTVVEVDTASSDDRRRGRPGEHRRGWTGVRHTTLHDQLVALARTTWQASWVVVDATGVGAGLASFLHSSLRAAPAVKVRPFVFSASSKSKLGWDFIGLIDSGRFLEYDPGDEPDEITREYAHQLEATAFEVTAPPANLLRWSVPAHAGHDDLVVSAALCAALDELDLRPRIARGSFREGYG